MAYLKPQSPIKSGEDHVYPLTTYDQIIMADGSRWDGTASGAVSGNFVSVDLSDTEQGAAALVDSDLLGGKPPAHYLSPRNLLDNSDFTNPVNQRGQTSWSDVDGTSYHLDRWRNGNGDFSVTKNGLNVTWNGGGNGANVQQLMSPDSIIGKAVTLAVKVNGHIKVLSVSSFTENGSFELLDGYVYLKISQSSNIYITIQIRSTQTTTIEWAALYEGEYTADNLPPYVPKGYAAELAACQYYAFLVEAYQYSRIGACRVGASNAVLMIPTPYMRPGGTPSLYVVSGNVSDLIIENVDIYVTELTVYGYPAGCIVNVLVNVASDINTPNFMSSIRNNGTTPFRLLISRDL